ncbi:D-2-hydroxyacid dehydrogenase [Mycolicibacterium smegmatis]|uniref:D-2-hydroxyacid dehydrogenase n=1 Tax=Mycolicibacterium smegmatis TaxID=1772 RepID=UPI0018E53E81|nr:D-2-hydroxyacid dehydrogenase [Mycolicibacterium smegmatis]
MPVATDSTPQRPERLRVVASTPISEDLIERIVAREPRIDFIRDQSLLPPQRFAGDHVGDPAFRRTADQQRAFEQLVDSAQALYGLPDEQPAALRRTVRNNPNLLWVHTMAAGGGGQIKAAELSDDELGRIAFTTSAGVHAEPLAEYALFGLLAGAKTLPRLLRQQRERRWTDRWEMGLLSQQRILLVGLGGIGRVVARKLAALGVTVVGTSRSGEPVEGVAELVHPDDLIDAVRDVDGIVVSLPGTAATENMVNAKVLRAAKPGFTLVSLGRGTVIDEPALIDALRDGQVGFAALDVFAAEPLAPESPLWSDEKVLISPHTAALNSAEDRLIADLFAENATRFLDGSPMRNRVDTVEFY